MRHRSIPFRETRSFSNFFLDYIEQNPSLKDFYHRFPKVENFKAQIEEKIKSFPKENRQVLLDTLNRQYQNIEASDSVKSNLGLLASDKTFTVTTGHQLNIFTGPLYFIYKIVTVINSCKKLRERYPEYNFVPVYWMASEDHDYEEIKSFRLNGKKYTWETDQKGAVGRFHLKDFVNILADIPGEIGVFKKAYLKHKTLSEAVRFYVNELFKTEGLIVIDADDRALKNLFRGVMTEDIFKSTPANLVNEATKKLEAIGYHTQVHARDINFFYLDNQLRGRIEKQGEEFVVLESDLRFSKKDIQHQIESEPEKFSPNVVLRPLYQEMILPNLAYVGGPAEIVYWLQLKGVFDNFQIPLPILMPRNFSMVIDAPTERKIEKTGLEIKDFFEDKNYIFNHWVVKNTHHDLSIGQEIHTIQELFKKIQKRASAIDRTLGPYVEANSKKVGDRLEHIEKKIFKAEKRLHADKLGQIEAIKDILFPGGSLQERTDNFLNFFQQDPDFIKKITTCFNPFDFQFNVLSYDTAHE
jgi:bacillithiol biosynthesis cysteine-adding enzyme BshC